MAQPRPLPRAPPDATLGGMISDLDVQAFARDGHVVARGLFSPDEARALRDHVTDVRRAGAHPLDDAGIDPQAGDPLLRWPRLVQLHRWDATARRWLLSDRVAGSVGRLLGCEPLAVQSMVYFKPPGARGQAMHQDQYFLRARPGTCMAAWMALDDTDEANGCLEVVPGSQGWPVLCPVPADTTVSSARDSLALPEGTTTVPIRMRAGDVLFFNGSLVHGSAPNRTEDRFRRSLIAHFVEERAEAVVEWDQPALRPDGTELWLGVDEEGGPCGVWVERDDEPVLETTGDLGPNALLMIQ